MPEAKRTRSVAPSNDQHFSQYTYELLVPYGQPGFTGRYAKVLVPETPSARRMPCLFYNPPGATVFTGKSIGSTSVDPVLPYVNAGFVVVIYGTDGGTVDLGGRVSMKVIAQQAHQYGLAHAGLIHGRNAINFVLQELLSIDPHRLYTIGHSSVGKQALLLAAADSRITGCVAFAPACEISKEEADTIAKLNGLERRLRVSFLEQSNPLAFANRLTVPVLLVSSASDRVIPAQDVVRFGAAVGENADVRLVYSPDHFSIPDAALGMTRSWLSMIGHGRTNSITMVHNSNGPITATNLVDDAERSEFDSNRT